MPTRWKNLDGTLPRLYLVPMPDKLLGQMLWEYGELQGDAMSSC